MAHGEGLTKKELLTLAEATGGYGILPAAVRARTDLTAAAKLVYSAIVDHFRGVAREVWPSVTRLAEMTGSSRTTAIAAIKQLTDRDLVAAIRTPGKPTRYALKFNLTGTNPELVQLLYRCGFCARLVQKLNKTGTVSEPEAEQSQETEYTPQPPAGAGGGLSSPAATPDDDATDGDGHGDDGHQATTTAIDGPDDLVAMWGEAYEATFGESMAWTGWGRNLHREYDAAGCAGILARVTAADFAAADKAARDAGTGLNFRRVLKTIERRLADERRAARRAERQAQRPTTPPSNPQSAIRNPQSEAADRLDWFRSLDEETRTVYVDRILALPFADHTRVHLVERQAAAMAAKELQIAAHPELVEGDCGLRIETANDNDHEDEVCAQ